MQNLNMNDQKILLLMQIAKLMPHFSVQEIYQNANALMTEFLLRPNPSFGLNGLSATPNQTAGVSIYRKDAHGTKPQEEPDRKSPAETCLPNSEANPNTSLTSPAVLNTTPERIELNGKSEKPRNRSVFVNSQNCLNHGFKRAEQNAPQKEQNNILKEQGDLPQEKDGLIKEEDGLPQEQTGLLQEKDSLPQGQDALIQEHHDLLKEQDSLPKKQDGLLKQSKKIVKEKVTCKSLKDSVSSKGNTPQPVEKITKEKAAGPKGKKKEHWQPEEDKKLLEFYNLYGPRWSKIAGMLGDRKRKQVRDRYINFLRPGIKSEEWTSEEISKLEKLVLENGKKWCTIAAKMGRTENQVKNRYYCIVHREERKSRRLTVSAATKSMDYEPVKEEQEKSDKNYMTEDEKDEKEEKMSQKSLSAKESVFKPIPLQLQTASVKNIPLQLTTQVSVGFVPKSVVNNNLEDFLGLRRLKAPKLG